MAKLIESICLNWFNEANNTYGIKLTTAETQIVDRYNGNIFSDKKVIQAINNAWPQIQKYRDEFIEDELDTWYQDENGNYEYGANTVEKVLKFATLDVISGIRYDDGKISIEVWYNSKFTTKAAEQLFGGHSLIIGFYIQSNYKVTDMECELAG